MLTETSICAGLTSYRSHVTEALNIFFLNEKLDLIILLVARRYLSNVSEDSM